MSFSRYITSALVESARVSGAFRRAAANGGPSYDFAIGQPNLPHAPGVQAALAEVARDRAASLHPYPPTVGIAEARAAVAGLLNRQHARDVVPEDVMITAGAAGALHVIFRTFLDPGDEVVTPAPFFLEYKHYVESYGAKLVVAKCADVHALDAGAVAAALSPRTKLLLLCSPNNPSGTAYHRDELREVGRVLAAYRQKHRRELVVVSDETYRRLAYGDAPPASPWAELESAILVGSFSKDLGLAGERIGYLALSRDLGRRHALDALALSQRLLGFMNAPLVWQRALPRCIDATANVADYRRKRDALTEVLIAAGLELALPDGGLFILARSPIDDDEGFTEILARHGVLVLPGRLYGAPGYVRATFSVDDDVIRGSSAAWQSAVYEALGMESVRAIRVG